MFFFVGGGPRLGEYGGYGSSSVISEAYCTRQDAAAFNRVPGHEGHTLQQRDACSDFSYGSADKIHDWSQPCDGADGPFGGCPHWWRIFSNFLTFCWWSLAPNACHLELTLNWLWSTHATQKSKECSPEAWRNISKVMAADLSGFMPNFMQAHCWNLSVRVTITEQSNTKSQIRACIQT